MIYTVFVEIKGNIRSFQKIATTNFDKAQKAFDEMVKYYEKLCSWDGQTCRSRKWDNPGWTTFVDCRIIENAKDEFIIHFNKFEDA